MVRLIEEKDYEDVLCLIKESFNHGDIESLKSVAKSDNYVVLVNEAGGKVVGFVSLLVVDELAEIIEVAVGKEYRGKGFAKELLNESVSVAKRMGKSGLHLEVRETNISARGLYKTFGFTEIFVRKNYYEGRENAIIMQLRF